ncbi:hypothetical protein D3C77_445180 [compost metagenome]
MGRSLTLFLLEVSGVNDYREAGAQHGFGQLVQALVGGLAGVFAVNAGLQLACTVASLLTVHAFALYIRAQANRPQCIDQTHGYVALANGRNTMGDSQEA